MSAINSIIGGAKFTNDKLKINNITKKFGNKNNKNKKKKNKAGKNKSRHRTASRKTAAAGNFRKMHPS